MALIRFDALMENAERGRYAVGYFESWNLESLLAVADAAEAMRSPVILGYSGIFLPHEDSIFHDRLGDYAALAREMGERMTVPACLLFNESPHLDWIFEAIRRGFGIVMFTDERLSFEKLVENVRRVVAQAHPAGVAVEGEMDALPGVGGELLAAPEFNDPTDPARAKHFVESTGIDAIAVKVGQAHLHGRGKLRLDMERISQLKESLAVPLVLHGASSISPRDLSEAISRGIRKINVGSVLKRVFFDTLYKACQDAGADYNPYVVLGSGMENDVLAAARRAMQRVVEEHMGLFGSAGKAAFTGRR